NRSSCWPLLASATSKPLQLSAIVTISLISLSSSTTIIRFAMCRSQFLSIRRTFRSLIDSTHALCYHTAIEIIDIGFKRCPYEFMLFLEVYITTYHQDLNGTPAIIRGSRCYYNDA